MENKTLTPEDSHSLGEPEVTAVDPIVAPVEGVTTEEVAERVNTTPPVDTLIPTRLPSATFQVMDASGAVLVIEPEDDLTPKELYLIQALVTQMVSATAAVRWAVLSYIHTHGLNRHFKVVHIPEGLIQREEPTTAAAGDLEDDNIDETSEVEIVEEATEDAENAPAEEDATETTIA